MRVLQLGPYPPPHGGVQTNLVAIREYLRARGIPCAVINITGNRKPDADEVYYPRSALGLLWLLVRLRYDVVHLHIGGDLTLRLLGLCLVCALVPRARAVLTFHSGGYPSSPAGLAARPRTLRGLVLRRLDRVIGVNPELARLFERFGVPAERIRLIYPFASASAPAGASAPLPAPLADFFARHEPALVTVGLLEPEYDLPLQIEALARIRERFPRAGLAIIGSGSLEDDLRGRIAATPYAEHILLAGDVPHASTLQAIAMCDALLRTTLYDGDAISVREGLQLGTPVIATDNGMRPAGVRLVPKQSPDALVDAVTAVLHDPPDRRVASGQARADAERNLEAVLEVYRELTDAPMVGRMTEPVGSV